MCACEIDAMISQRKTYSVPLPEIIPVALVYLTRFPDERGQVVSHPDIYNHRRAEEAPVSRRRPL